MHLSLAVEQSGNSLIAIDSSIQCFELLADMSVGADRRS